MSKIIAPHEAIAWAKQRLDDVDSIIAETEKTTARLQGEARARADESLKTLRDKRDAYRAQTEEAAANAKTWTNAQVAAARKSLDENWTAFQVARDEYLDAAQADLATRQAIMQADLEALRKAWQKSIDELRAEAAKVSIDQRSAVNAQIAALNAQMDEAKARIDRLQDVSAEAWETTKKGYADAQKLFFDTYASIRKSIEDAMK